MGMAFIYSLALGYTLRDAGARAPEPLGALQLCFMFFSRML